ncbi:hypothetical protein F1645_09525 [Novacetimonas hansenii]
MTASSPALVIAASCARNAHAVRARQHVSSHIAVMTGMPGHDMAWRTHSHDVLVARPGGCFMDVGNRLQDHRVEVCYGMSKLDSQARAGFPCSRPFGTNCDRQHQCEDVGGRHDQPTGTGPPASARPRHDPQARIHLAAPSMLRRPRHPSESNLNVKNNNPGHAGMAAHAG